MGEQEATVVESTADEKAQKRKERAEKWLKAIEKSLGREKKWRMEKAPAVIKRYRDERDVAEGDSAKFSILWANTETLKPAIFNRMPIPDVRRRFTTRDPAARTAALILERCLAYCTDAYDLQDTLDRSLEDYVLPGRAVAVVRYVPTIEKQQERVKVEPLPFDEGPEETTREELEAQFAESEPEPTYPEGTLFDAQGPYTMQTKETLVYQEVCADYVPWDLFCMGEGKTWKKIPWVAAGALVTKSEAQRRYPHFEHWDDVNFDHTEREVDGIKEVGHFALLWDVWHKLSREFIVVCQGYSDDVIFEQPDPLELECFYPFPEPMYSVRNNKTWEPKPEYCMYQDQAIELDVITDRMKVLTKALKVRGGYDQSIDNEQFKFADMMNKPDNALVPIAGWRALMEKGGLEGIVDFLPLDQILEALQYLVQREEQLKNQIYEITGISDIVRGSTVASETLGAQQMKAQYAGLRIGTRQQRFQRFIREIYQIQGEIIAEHFEPETLKLMSGINVVPDQSYEQMKGEKKLPAGTVSESEFMAAVQLLRNDKLRGFRIDIETDSTIPADKEAEQQNRIQFLQAIAGYMKEAMPAVQAGMLPAPVAREGLLFAVRAFKVGSELEEVLEQIGEDQQGPSPQQLQQMQQQMQALQAQLQQLTQENQQLKSEQAVKMQNAQADIQVEQFKAQKQAETNAWQAQQDAMLDKWKAEQEIILKRMEGFARAMQPQPQPPRGKPNGKSQPRPVQ